MPKRMQKQDDQIKQDDKISYKKQKQNEEEKEESSRKSKTIKLTRKSENFIRKLPVEATGALGNVLLRGCSKRTNKALLKVTGIVRPYKNVHDQIKELGEWREFVKRCLQLHGFRDHFTTYEEMENWLNENAREGSLSSLGSDHEEDLLIIIKPGEDGSQFLLMGDQITNPRGFSYSQVENFIPRPAKTKEHKKHTLVLHRSGFQIDQDSENSLTKFKMCRLMIDLETRQEVHQQVINKHFIQINDDFGIFYESGKKSQYVPNLSEIGILIDNMDSGELKSLLQKLLRFAPQFVEMGPNKYETGKVLQAVCECSLVHHGGRSPNTGLYVRGLPSFLKRLAVTMVEDAWANEEILHDLLLMSLIATNDPNYFPTYQQCQTIFKCAQFALVNAKAVIYKQELNSAPIPLTKGLSLLKRASCFLDILKSFPWDLTMVRYVAKNEVKFQEPGDVCQRPEVMDISQYCDHHVGPEFAYFLHPKALKYAQNRYVPSEIFGDLNDQESCPFAMLFREVFHCVSGFNYRRTPTTLKYMLQEDPFAKLIRFAQSRYFMAKHVKFVECETRSQILCDTLLKVEVELDRMWIAAAIGHMQVRVNKTNYFVFITQVDPIVTLDVVRCPARQQKNIEIDEEEKKEAIQKGFQLLRKGVIIQEAQSVFGNGQEVLLVKNQLHFKNEKDIHIPDMIAWMQTKVCMTKVKNLLMKSSVECLKRLWQLTLGFCTRLEFPKISRKGGAEDKPICIHDIEVFQLCLLLSPVLDLKERRYFEINQRVVWWHIRKEILKPLIQELLGNNNVNHDPGWTIHPDSMNRVPSKSQTIAISILNKRVNQCNFIIMPGGSGKTFIIGQKLLNLAKLPRFVLFTTPSSAIEAVARELRCFTDAVHVRDMTKAKKSNEDLQPGITIISHDHLRMAKDLFRKTLPRTYLVLDEFHNCLAQKTLRTKAILECASACQEMTAMSGTPSLSNSLYDLLGLISTISPFEVTLKNFFVAYSFAINQKDCVDIKVVNEVKHLDMPQNHDAYWKLLPNKLGGKNNRRLEGKDLNDLIQYSQDVASLELAKITAHHVLELKNSVFVVARKAKHVQELHDLIVKQGIQDNDIYCIFKRTDTITLTEASLMGQNKDPRIKRYKVVICPISIHDGFSMPIFNVQISTVYMSNAASREQILWRITRLSSTFKQVLHVEVICGRIQELIAFRYDKDDSLASILKDPAFQVVS